LDPLQLDDIRERNNTRLLPLREQIRAGQHCDLLIPYAKAYLGLFLNLDNRLPPDERLASFVDQGLLPDIYQGFEASVDAASFPTPEQFSSPGQPGQLERCWVLLACFRRGIDHLGDAFFDRVSSSVRQSAFCFVMTLEQGERPDWPERYLVRYQQEAEQALMASWKGSRAATADVLPGMDWYFGQPVTPSTELIYWIMANWRHLSYGNCYALLYTACRFGEPDRLAELADAALQEDFPVRTRMLWCGVALVSDPRRHAQALQGLCGFNKEKIVPLLDFCVSVLEFIPEPERRARISAALIRIAGPKFPPFDDSDPIVAKLALLLSVLADGPVTVKRELIETLDKVRVLRAYRPALRKINIPEK